MRRLCAVSAWLIVILLLAVLVTPVDAHRSGCHRWHSCPSDHATYVCGDTGHCSQCPDNEYCLLAKPRPVKRRSDPEPSQTGAMAKPGGQTPLPSAPPGR